MKRFKDSKVNYNLVTSQKNFLKFPLPPFFWDTKRPPSLGYGDYMGAKYPKVPENFIKNYRMVQNVIDMKKGTDEKFAVKVQLGLNIATMANILTGSLGKMSGFAPELSYMMGPAALAGIISQLYLAAKPSIRRGLIAIYPHTVEALKNFNTKQYSINTYNKASGAGVTSQPMTMDQIVKTMQGAKFDDSGSVWTKNKTQYAFKSKSDVDDINHMFKHNFNSEIRDTFLTWTAPSATLLATGLSMNEMVKSSHKSIDAYQAQAQDVEKKAPVYTQPNAPSSSAPSAGSSTGVFDVQTGQFKRR